MRKNFGVVSGVLFAVFVLCTSASAMTISINGSGGAVVTDVSSAIRDEVKGDVFDFIEDGEFYGVELSVEASTITIDYEVGGEEAYRGYFFLNGRHDTKKCMNLNGHVRTLRIKKVSMMGARQIWTPGLDISKLSPL